MLPVLGALEGHYRTRSVVVLGIHTPKFTAEKSPRRIRDAMRRMDVDHPVLVDTDRGVWEQYAVRAWPTLVFIRPNGTIHQTLAGEVRYERLVDTIDEMLQAGEHDGTLAAAPVSLDSAESSLTGLEETQLAYPTSLVPTPSGLAIADSGHHRIVLTDGKGRIVESIGNGEPGLKDGSFEKSLFKRPQGLELVGQSLYVADAGNHAVRAIDVRQRSVRTVIGDGILGMSVPQDLVKATDVRPRSPSDLAFGHGILLIAMAGSHQIWAYLPEQGSVTVLAGTGREAIDDGLFHEATFSQPTGLSWYNDELYVADSEASAIRRLNLDTARVETLVGKGLFHFGDEDGPIETARLQHAQNLSGGPHGLLIADSYNNKIRHLSAAAPDGGQSCLSTWYGSDPGQDLDEPTGIIQLGSGQVLIADTNNHRILVIDGETKAAKVLPVDNEPVTSTVRKNK